MDFIIGFLGGGELADECLGAADRLHVGAEIRGVVCAHGQLARRIAVRVAELEATRMNVSLLFLEQTN